ncbi:MAG TPA: ribosome biogenesis factor YjgA, partial [Burkholderiaceae bacterium]|nr:ribosome biogenesis factor YjgA [Burkholderiaceae bacterium]
RVTAREGRRRQLQYVGKLMRTVEVEPLRQALERLTDGERAATALLHSAERWRQRLLGEPADRQQSRQQWLERHPHCPAARLDGLIAGALAESAAGQHGRQYRELFRLIRDTLAAPAVTPSSTSSTQGHD